MLDCWEKSERLPTARYCSCPQWYGRKRCPPAPPAHLRPPRWTVCPPRGTACLPVLWTASRCGSGYLPGRPPKTAADTTTPRCTEGRGIKHKAGDVEVRILRCMANVNAISFEGFTKYVKVKLAVCSRRTVKNELGHIQTHSRALDTCQSWHAV